ncbi:MAG: DUF3857 domain-containing protein [Gemmatimonadaceae bacterium]|nr:DUF3857 domain-containing protein [Chitinophagaceae bacterium]
MNLRIPTLTICIMAALSVNAQKDTTVPAFGKIRPDEIALKQCEFDKNANAVILFSTSEVYFSFSYLNNKGNFYTVTEERMRIKILNEKGVGQGDIHLLYSRAGNLEKIKNISAQTYNISPNGEVTISKLDNASIFEKRNSRDQAEIAFSFPDVKPGSIIEYKFQRETSYLRSRNWYFQADIPVKLSRYTVSFQNELEIATSALCTLPVQFQDQSRKDRQIRTYVMTDIPGLRDEPYLSCIYDYLQRVELKLLSAKFSGSQRQNLTPSWGQLTDRLNQDNDFGMQFYKNLSGTEELDAQLATVKDPLRRMKMVYNYVRKNMACNNRDNYLAEEGMKKAWKEKTGTQGEVNMILISLLKEAKLKVRPMLASSTEHGLVNMVIPDYDQFNRLLAHVTIDEKVYVLDATEKYTAPGLIPHDVMYSQGLLFPEKNQPANVMNFGGDWFDIWDEMQLFKRIVIITADVDKAGDLSGQASISNFDYARLGKSGRLEKGNDKYVDDIYGKHYQGYKHDKLQIENHKIDSLPLVEKFDFSNTLPATGDYRYFKINLFSGLEENPFILDKRFSDVFFTSRQNFQIFGNYTIPENYVFEELPKNIQLIMPDTSIVLKRTLSAQDGLLSVRMSVEYRKPIYTLDEYEDLQEFSKKMYGILNEQIVIKKRTRP